MKTKRKAQNQATFLARAKKTHGDKYTYENVEFINMRTKVIITCPIHGKFSKIPDGFLCNGRGCPKCSAEATKENLRQNFFKIFINRLSQTHLNTFQYYEDNFKGMGYNTKCTCKRCGYSHEINPQIHPNIKNIVCLNCTNKVHDYPSFIKSLNINHGENFKVKPFNFINTNQKIIAYCNRHKGYIETTPKRLLRKNSCGCIPCSNIIGGITSRISSQEFIEKVYNKHGDSLDYTNTQYTLATNKVSVSCKIHGDFDIMPYYLLDNKFGCPKCAREYTLSPYFNKPTKLYYIKITHLKSNKVYYKIGITINSLAQRYRVDLKNKDLDIQIISVIEYKTGKEAFLKEQEILNKYSEFKPKRFIKLLIGGNTELFTKDVLNFR